MTDNELELLNMIREHNTPENAVITAINVIFSYLEQRESSGEPFAAYLPEST